MDIIKNKYRSTYIRITDRQRTKLETKFGGRFFWGVSKGVFLNENNFTRTKTRGIRLVLRIFVMHARLCYHKGRGYNTLTTLARNF